MSKYNEEVSKLCSMCRDLGYIGSLADEHFHDSTGSDIADMVVTYMTELFNELHKGGDLE